MTAGKSIVVTAARRLLIVLGLVPIPLVSGTLVVFNMIVAGISLALSFYYHYH